MNSLNYRETAAALWILHVERKFHSRVSENHLRPLLLTSPTSRSLLLLLLLLFPSVSLVPDNSGAENSRKFGVVRVDFLCKARKRSLDCGYAGVVERRCRRLIGKCIFQRIVISSLYFQSPPRLSLYFFYELNFGKRQPRASIASRVSVSRAAII